MIKENYIIRDFESNDFASLIELWDELDLSSKERGDDLETIERTLEIGGRLLLLENIIDNKILGSSWLTHDGRRIYLHHFGICKEYQGKGLSHLLLDESLFFAKELNMQIKLEVHKNNEVASKLYKKAGFKLLGDYIVMIIRKFS